MGTPTRLGATAAAFAAAIVLSAGVAGAASASAASGSSDTDTGAMTVCNHGGYGFDVYADGPDSFVDDLAGSFNECANWTPATPGQYNIGFSFPYAPPVGTLFQIRIKADGTTSYRTFNGQGSFDTNVRPGRTTRIDFYIK